MAGKIKNPFPPELRTMAFVPRWCIVATTIKDNVATHTFFVTTYAYLIARMIGWDGPKDYLMLRALMHDNDETITGDITGTIKALTENDKLQEVIHDKTEERMEGLVEAYYELEDVQPDIIVAGADAIVLAADKLDALLFLILNKRMGNTTVEPAITGNQKSLEAAWRGMPAPKEVLDSTWATQVLPSIASHYERGGRGFALGVAL